MIIASGVTCNDNNHVCFIILETWNVDGRSKYFDVAAMPFFISRTKWKLISLHSDAACLTIIEMGWRRRWHRRPDDATKAIIYHSDAICTL